MSTLRHFLSLSYVRYLSTFGGYISSIMNAIYGEEFVPPGVMESGCPQNTFLPHRWIG